MKKVLLSLSSWHLRCRTTTKNHIIMSDGVGGMMSWTTPRPLRPWCRYDVSQRRLLFSHATAAVPSESNDRTTGSGTNSTSTSSSCSSSSSHIDEEQGPTGVLFQSSHAAPIGPELIGARGMIGRTFGPRSNAEGLLATGGPDLAAHASFDPDYGRAQDWIRHHAVGPAVLSPILISGLTGALTEAAFPHGVITHQSMQHVRPLIVGVPVAAMIEVVNVTKAIQPTHTNNNNNAADTRHSDLESADINQQQQQRKHGYDVTLRTIVSRVRDDCIIAEGTLELWVPDYRHM